MISKEEFERSEKNEEDKGKLMACKFLQDKAKEYNVDLTLDMAKQIVHEYLK